jgi:hypothetical protein
VLQVATCTRTSLSVVPLTQRWDWSVGLLMFSTYTLVISLLPPLAVLEYTLNSTVEAPGVRYSSLLVVCYGCTCTAALAHIPIRRTPTGLRIPLIVY